MEEMLVVRTGMLVDHTDDSGVKSKQWVCIAPDAMLELLNYVMCVDRARIEERLLAISQLEKSTFAELPTLEMTHEAIARVDAGEGTEADRMLAYISAARTCMNVYKQVMNTVHLRTLTPEELEVTEAVDRVSWVAEPPKRGPESAFKRPVFPARRTRIPGKRGFEH